MEQEKRWYLSRGVWGSLVVIIAAAASLTPEDTQLLNDTILELLTAIGGALALWGRIFAKKTLKK